ncbi:MAG TPA: quinohemoprotein amine dehydrogenase subunit alpha [Candidatus Binatia bacterium]|jgi:quinohemoprotein amine dehydrogenase|nr:quinohemoprotein amine dehydrogenase subunit alpha [Candidatus Binatia bacterium]
MSSRRKNLDAQSAAFSLFFLLLWVACGTPQAWGAQASGAQVLENRCSGCHPPQEDGKLDAVEFQRKTPEGWEMTLDRMVRTHGASLQPGEGALLVKYLSDRYGLAPSEVEPFQYILERRNRTATQPEIPKVVQGSCVQCHSYARTALQRRTPEMWERMPDTKLALFVNTENVTASSGLLGDFWYTEAKREVVPYLAKKYPFVSDAWSKWQAAAKPDYAGSWKVVGHDPGKGGDYTGRLTLRALGDDRYEGEFTHEFADGTKGSGKTTAIIYTGFQWRGIAQLDDHKQQKEIFFASEDGTVLKGRRLLTARGDLGMDETLYKDDHGARVLTVIPTAVKAGETQKVKLFGMNFPGNLTAEAVRFGDGVKVQSLSQAGDDTVIVEVAVEKEVEVGPRQAKITGVGGEPRLYVYKTVDYIRLSPEQGFARPGGVRAEKISQQFEVFAYLNGQDGMKGTEDDVKLDRVAPVRWNVEEYVKRLNDDDVRFVGRVDQAGLFTPANDGPNPQRHLSEHNVGDIWVEAWYKPEGAKRPMGARASLLVMPEKFNFPPIE